MRAASDVKVSADRVHAHCDELARFTSSPDGLRREYLSKEHAAVNALAGQWMREAGMSTWMDAAGNQCGRLEGPVPGAPALVLGSHLDTVPDAGKYDGMLGVTVAIEVASRLRRAGHELPFALEVVAFGDEEGTRFGRTLLGSYAFAGQWDDAWWELSDREGQTLWEAAVAFGLNPGRIGAAARRPEDLVGYLEAHIEQRPFLEKADEPLGVVTGIAGARRFQFSVIGQADHAGTPYEYRHDALAAAAEMMCTIERIVREADLIATIGTVGCEPGGVNIVPGRATFSLDIRAEDDDDRDRVVSEIEAASADICLRRGVRYRSQEIHSAHALHCAPRLRAAIERGIVESRARVVIAGRERSESDPVPQLFSPAGHDGMALRDLTDVGMLFIRCAGGISHSPEESVEVADVAAAIVAFEAAVLAVAEEPQ
jgi:amidase, hydantoinase/carbamoylase family